jgi:hypothetical protein
MKNVSRLTLSLVVLLGALTSAYAQQTTGNIAGRAEDEQRAAVPGVTVTARNASTGFVRTAVSDAEGLYRLTALPVGDYELQAELSGFATLVKKKVIVTVGQTTTIDLELKVANLSETVNVTGETPMIEATSSSVGGVVEVKRIENLPLNGRQFANLAATVPGVSLGFHADPTKSTQYSPQVAGGNGRNVNYLIDGGDNNDDTVGGLLQMFPLEAIQEFNLITQRSKAEYGRSNGGVMNIVTKGGTNSLRGSWFNLFRDKSLNATTFTEQGRGDPENAVPKQDYRRSQFGGSIGGPIRQNAAHFFVAYERTQQDTTQKVDTFGLFPEKEGVFPTPYRETLITAKVTANVTPGQYLSVRYGRNSNSQPYGATAQSTQDNWGLSENQFNSINVNHNWVVGGTKLNEFIFQYANFKNNIGASSSNPYELYPNGVSTGFNLNTPQTTQQAKWQFRDDFSWHVTGRGGLGHDFKAGANLIWEPRLYTTFNAGVDIYQYTHLTDDPNGPLTVIQKNGGYTDANMPMKQLGVYFQDDWRINSRLTLNLGLRYDLMLGYQIDQSRNDNFTVLQEAGRAGRFTGVVGMEDFGKTPREDYNNIQPRLGFAYDVRGNGRDVVRGGWGIYTDFGYTNSNILFAALDANGKSGPVFQVSNPNGIRNPDGTFYRMSQPISNIQSLNEVSGELAYIGQVISPRLQQPYTRQAAIGWSHEIAAATVFSADYVHTDGRDLNVRFRPNTRPNGGPRRFSDLALNPNTLSLRVAINRGESVYDGLILGLRRRMTKGLDLTATYTLARALSTIGSAVDELDQNLVQDVSNPFDAPAQLGPPVRTGARHRLSLSAMIQLPGGFNVAPIFTWRTALPLFINYGIDLNNDYNNNDIGDRALAFRGIDERGEPRYEDIGPCKTVNCGWGAPFSQLNLRVSKVFAIGGRLRVEAIGELFNVFNALNPSFTVATAGNAGRRFLGTAALPVPNPNFMRPNDYAGDFQQPEQRVGQLGFRITF